MMAMGTIGHFALVAALKLPFLNSPGTLPFLERVPSGKIQKLRPAFT